MLSGLKFIPRDQIAQDDSLTGSSRRGENSGSRNEKVKKKKKASQYSSDDEDVERIKKGSRKKKWYSSDEDFSSVSCDSGSERDSDNNTRKNSKKEKKRRKYSSKEEDKSKSKKDSRRREYSYDDSSDVDDRDPKKAKKDGQKKYPSSLDKEIIEDESEGRVSRAPDGENIVRKEMGLEWMLRPKGATNSHSAMISDLPEEPSSPEKEKVNPKELNPYLKDNGSGYPEDSERGHAGKGNLFSTSLVGDGGASWRLKALKRAQEQAAREGKKLDEVVEERWGSVGQLAVSVASRSAAPSRAHLHAIKNRIRRQTEGQPAVNHQSDTAHDSIKDSSVNQPKMKVPRVHGSLSWGKHKSKSMPDENASIIASAMSSLNKFANDGSFMRDIMNQQNKNSEAVKADLLERENPSSNDAIERPVLTANQLAAKAMQLRMKGKVEEAEKLLKEAEENSGKNDGSSEPGRRKELGGTTRYVSQGSSVRQRKKEEDADAHLARSIVQNKQYSISGRADDEYDYDEAPRRKMRKKEGNHTKSLEKPRFEKRILTQQERCSFCFENPSRPRHLVVSIANFTYLMLPQREPVTEGHCYILPLQHELSTRTVDDNVWDEIRNFKKCLIMMFAKQEMDVIFIETVMGLARQRRHCLVECIPMPSKKAKQAPVYFKKAIDEAEDEWSQHNSKKLIDTSERGLRSSIPKDFPYFHVEFGLKQGFVHVIDDESQFNSNFGLNVLRGMLKTENLHSRQQLESIEAQKERVASFLRDWEPFDWTKQLDG